MAEEYDNFDDALTGMSERLEEMTRRWQAQTRAVRDVDFIAAGAIKHWTKDGLDFYLCESAATREIRELVAKGILKEDRLYDFGLWNGYVKFPKLPGILPGCSSIYTYVPVHGGITFFQEWADGSVTYGFDTAHSHSGSCPVHDLNWMETETESMGRSIQIAARFERYYLAAGEDNRKKARVLDRMGKFLPLEVLGNFGAMVNLLTGEL